MKSGIWPFFYLGENLDFKDIPDDKPATFKQKQAAAFKIANADHNLMPELSRFVLAKRIQGAMYGLEQRTGINFTHGEIQKIFKKPVLPEKIKKEMEDYFKVNQRFTKKEADENKEDPKNIPKGTDLKNLF